MSAPSTEPRNNPLVEVSNAMVALHKEQFGRGPTAARSDFAGQDTLVCTLENALLPAEHAMVKLGQQLRVQESRLFLQNAAAERMTSTIEEIVGRKVRAFGSACDPTTGTVMEIFIFERDGTTPPDEPQASA
jgi:uncharacterized protein YbcI